MARYTPSKKSPSQYLVMGKNCIHEVWLSQKKRIRRLYTSLNLSRNVEPWIAEMARCVETQIVSEEQLSRLVRSDSHQQMVAELTPRPGLCLDDFLAASTHKEKSLVLLLDSIFDPQNLGALLRAAECFGVDAVVWSKNRGVDITPVVTKASVGASELVPLIKVSNLAQTAERLRKHDYQILAAALGDGAIPLDSYARHDKVVLMVGSEGRGLQPLLLKTADQILFIPMQGRIQSLNVSQATSIFLERLASC